MQQAPEPTSVQLIRGELTLAQWLSYAFFAVFGVIAFFAGSIATALFVIMFVEIMITLWRPTPRLTAQSYTTPASSVWRPVGQVARWYGLAEGCQSIALGFVICAAMLALVFIFIRPHSLGPANYAVLVLFGVWLLGHPIWSPRLKGWVSRQTADVRKELALTMGPSITLRPDGMDVDFRWQSLGSRPAPPRVVSIEFAELQEVRTLDARDAQAYWDSVVAYDPTLVVRVGTELFQYSNHMIARPSIYYQLSIGLHLLIRGATLLYVICGQDDSGPAAVAAFQAWQSAHAAPNPTPG